MKVVYCKDCGAKYQLDDTDDITTFECSSCAGDLEYVEDYANDNKTNDSTYLDASTYVDSYIVQCSDCGLKYKINNDENIINYECAGCGGSLRYLDEKMNKELDNYLKEQKEELKSIDPTTINNKQTSDEITEEIPKRSLKSITGKIENFFSEERMQEIAEEEKELNDPESFKTARTTIPSSVLNKFGKEFAVPKTNNYAIMKNFLKYEFYKGLDEYYPKPSKKDDEKSFFDKISIKEPELGEPEFDSYIEFDESATEIDDIEEEIKEFNFSFKKLILDNIILIVSIIIFIISIIEILTINSGFGIVALFIGVIGLIYGLYANYRNNNNDEKTSERTRVIREHLLTLPEDYYVFYNVKIPISTSSINHLVIGPTGIFAILSQKYESDENSNVNFNTTIEYNKIEEEIDIDRKFRYTTKQAKFSQNNEIKQRALTLGEDLINFLNENDIKNCFVEPLVGFINNNVVVINMPLTDDDLFIDELMVQIQNSITKLDQETIEKCAVLINRYATDCSTEI